MKGFEKRIVEKREILMDEVNILEKSLEVKGNKVIKTVKEIKKVEVIMYS